MTTLLYAAQQALEALEYAEAQRDALRAELREATAATNDPAVNNLRTLPESIRMLRAERDELLRTLMEVDTAPSLPGPVRLAIRLAIAKATGGDNAQ